MASLSSNLAKKAISGRKGGEGHTPVETPNNLLSTSSAKMLLALGEGEWHGSIDGSNIYLDGTPLLDSQGNENFPGTKWEFRPGSVQQTYIQGIPSVENELAINTELTDGSPWVRSVTNSMLSALRLRLRWPALQQQKDNGDIVGLTIAYRIEVATDGGGYQTLLQTSVTGKTNTTYERSHRIDLPAGSSWQVRVSRITPNQNKTIVADSMFIAAITEVVDAKFSYPNTALLYIEFDAEQFNSIPSVAVKAKMRKVRVPTNYDPIARTYSGTWDGSFKIAWTNNPAWISYDIILEDRFGTGQYIDASLVDKWELYQIAQYCDQSVPDGKGGSEPRFLCDIYIQQAKEAWQVLRDLAAIYRGMSYWANGQMYSVADMPRDMDFLYTNANVVDGKFSYTGTSVRSKFTRALVSYDDPDNDYNTDVTSVGDISLQQRFGDNPVELSAIGCTRESEAQRRGQWAIHTNNADRMVGFSVGLDGQVPLPGMIIGVADKLVAGKRFGGRIKAVNGLNITIDQACDAAANDSLIVNLPSGKAEKRTITSVNDAVITVSTAYSETPAEQLQWSVESNTLVPQLFRVMTIRKADSDEIEYQISAVEHNPSKFNAIDNGTKLLDRPISVLPAKTQASPATINISQRTYVEQTQSVTVMIIDWPKTDGAVAYDVQWRKDDGDWVSLPRTGSNSVEVVGVYTGGYLARVRAINSVNVASIYAESVLTDLTGKDANLSLPTSLTATSIAFGINLYWGFPLGSEDTLHTEIQIASDNFGSDAQKLVDVAYPSASYVVGNLPKGTAYYFRARLVDKVGNKGAFTPWTYGASSSNQSDYDTLFGETFRSYTWFAWADDDAGTGFTTNETAGKAKKWMGVATDKAVSAPSGNWEDYTWTKVQTDIPPVFTPDEEAKLDNLMAGKLPNDASKEMLALQDALADPKFNNNLLTAQQLLNQGIDAADLGGETPAGAQAKANAAEAAAALDALNKAQLAEANALEQSGGTNLLNISTFTSSLNKGGWNNGAVELIGNAAGVDALDARSHALKLIARDSYELNNAIPVTGGERLYFSAWMNTQLSNYQLRFGYRKVVNGIPQSYWHSACAQDVGEGWNWVQSFAVIPSDCTSIIPWLVINGYSDLGVAFVQDLVISRSPIKAGALAEKDSLTAGDVGADPAGSAAQAKTAAEGYALAQANLAETESKAYADNVVSAEEQRAIVDAQARADAAKAEAVNAAQQALDARINAGEASGLDNLLSISGLPFSQDLMIYGDSDKYYPVVFMYGSQQQNRRIKIWRSYDETAPDDWYLSTHKGQLNVDWFGNFGGWGGAGYFEQILHHTSAYTELLADAYRFGANMMYVFFLRGGGPGGAIYHFASDQNVMPQVFYNQELIHSPSNTYAPAPITTINSERLHNLKIGYSTIGNLLAYSAQFGSLKSRLASFGGITAETIAALAIATNHLQAGAVVTDKLAAGAVTSDKLTADTALINKLISSQGLFDELQARLAVFGGLAAQSIAANAISTKHLTIANTDNICTNPKFMNASGTGGNTEGWTGNVTVLWNNNPDAYGGASYLGLINNYRDTYFNYDKPFSVLDGEQYYLSLYAYHYQNPTADLRLGLMVRYSDGSMGWNTFLARAASERGAANFASGSVTVGNVAGKKVVSAALFIQMNGTNGAMGGGYYVTNVYLRKMASAELIVDGSITTQKLVSKAVTTDKIAANAVTANELFADSALINKLVASQGLFNDLVARLAVFGGLTANSIAAGAILGTHIKAGEKIQSPIIEGGQLRLIGSGYMKVQAATPFGPDSLVEWYGPKLLSGTEPNWGALKKSNAITYLAANGDAYFGGSLSAGVLKTGVTNPDKNQYAASSIPVLIGPFGTNGKAKNVVVSYDLSADSTTSSSSAVSNKSLQWQLQRSIGNGAWTTVASGTFTISVNKTWEPEFGYYEIREYCHASSTYTDNSTSTSDFQYRLLVVSATRYHVVSQVSSQTISIVSTEQ
ncbi:host specificity protein J [Shewanella sp. KCT]|uniref:host specificity protein J n=1 Tax=Shewanella sp. KCT TaxID=2569535 RepID=UPI001182790B|nr:host specificity protein J [Shewanella sp. KCT]TVP11816.1 hypothetical protein AYI87_15420 [Shewanella sp. KCT]